MVQRVAGKASSASAINNDFSWLSKKHWDGDKSCAPSSLYSQQGVRAVGCLSCGCLSCGCLSCLSFGLSVLRQDLPIAIWIFPGIGHLPPIWAMFHHPYNNFCFISTLNLLPFIFKSFFFPCPETPDPIKPWAGDLSQPCSSPAWNSLL